MTAVFYAALHLIEAWLPAPPRTRRHVDRLREMAQWPELGPIYMPYRILKQRSEDARYNCIPFTAAEVEFISTQLYLPLRRHMHGLLGI